MQMQNAECRCRMQMQNADCIAELQIRKHSAEISNGLRARSAGPDLIAHAHSAGPGALDRGPLAKKPSARKSDQHGCNIAPNLLQNCTKLHQHGCHMVLGSLLEASWRSLGAIKKAWSAKGGLPGAYGTLLDASWGALGAEKSSLERLLAVPREIPRQVSAILGAQRLPKGRPRGSKIESKRRLELKT